MLEKTIHSIVRLARAERAITGTSLGPFLHIDPNQVETQGRFQKNVKGSSFMGVAATPLKPLPSCYHVKRRRD